MKLSIFYDHLQEAAEQSKLSIDEVMQQARNAGITGLEINLTCLLEQEEKVVSLLEKYDMEISCIYEFYDWGNSADLTYGKRHVDMAKKMGTENILIVPGFLSQEETVELKAANAEKEALYQYMNTNAKVQQMRANLQELVDYAANQGICVSLEDFDNEAAPFATKWQLLWFMEHVEGLRFTMDIGNFVYSDEDACDGFTCLKPWMVHIHCKDRGEEALAESFRYKKGMAACPTGAGYLPTEQIIREVYAQGYLGYYAIEHFGAEDQLSCMQKSADFLWKLDKELA